MEAIVNINTGGLREYQTELNDLIKSIELMNEKWDKRRAELEKQGYNIEDVENILQILFMDA